MDLEKTMKGLKCHSEPKESLDECFCEVCPYDECTCGLDVPADALKLLKKMQKVKVKNIKLIGDHVMGTCPGCLRILTIQDHTGFCGTCGQAVKWYD